MSTESIRPIPEPCTSEQCLEVANQFKAASSALLVTLEDEEDRENRAMVLRDMVACLEGWSLHLGTLRGDCSARRQQQAAMELLACVRLARKLRGGGKQLETVVERSLQSLGLRVADYQGALDKLAKKSTIQRTS